MDFEKIDPELLRIWHLTDPGNHAAQKAMLSRDRSMAPYLISGGQAQDLTIGLMTSRDPIFIVLVLVLKLRLIL